MKKYKILITGNGSYVGTKFIEWLSVWPERYEVKELSVRGTSWKEEDFSQYDTVLHVAGIAHVSTDPKMEDLYYKVNRDLTIEVANKAKKQGVKQFIFMSSIIVYGDSSSDNKVIDYNTVPKPSNFYGNSKLQAEEEIKILDSNQFKVVIIRPPMIYGKGSKGNYLKLSKVARKLPIFPNIDNQRSMLHIDNLSELMRLIIENEDKGLFFPQNKEYVNTSQLVKIIADIYGKKIRLTKIFNLPLSFLSKKIGIINKVFGNLVYEKEISHYKENYQIIELRDSIMMTEKQGTINKRKDILLMCDNCLETIGGEQESTKIIINVMKEKFSLGIIQPGDIKKPIIGAEYYKLTNYTRMKHLVKKPQLFLKYILNVKNIINEAKPQIIHTQAQVSFFIVGLLKKFHLISPTIKIIHTERGLYTKYNKGIKAIFHFFLRELEMLVTTTEFNMKYWKEIIKKKGIPIETNVIENTAGELFEAYDLNLINSNSNTFVLGFAGRYCDWKNWPLAVEISEKLNDILGEELEVKMAVGCLDSKAEIETLEMFSHLKVMLGDRFQGQINIDLEEMDKFYYDIDAFILTSNYNTESFGRTLVEAMSRRTIVLTTNAGGSVEVVGDSGNVFNTADDFVKRLLELHGNQDLMEKEKDKNLTRVKENYSLNNNITKHFNLYNHLLNEKSQKSEIALQNSK